MSRYVTLKQLKRAGACSEYRDLFKDLFGKNGKVKITQSNVSALAGAFNLYWTVDNLLTPKQQAVYQYRIRNTPRPYNVVDTLMRLIPEAAIPPSSRHEIRVALRSGSNRVYEREAMGPAFAAAYNSPRK